MRAGGVQRGALRRGGAGAVHARPCRAGVTLSSHHPLYTLLYTPRRRDIIITPPALPSFTNAYDELSSTGAVHASYPPAAGGPGGSPSRHSCMFMYTYVYTNAYHELSSTGAVHAGYRPAAARPKGGLLLGLDTPSSGAVHAGHHPTAGGPGGAPPPHGVRPPL
eukprot:9504037-Pyramimonas_sp.AAC.3